jgi:hypothetical protein
VSAGLTWWAVVTVNRIYLPANLVPPPKVMGIIHRRAQALALKHVGKGVQSEPGSLEAVVREVAIDERRWSRNQRQGPTMNDVPFKVEGVYAWKVPEIVV